MREEGGRRASSFLTPKVQLAGLLMAGGGMVAAATVLGSLGRFGWLLDLCSHFRAQYAGYLALVVVLSCLTRKFRTAGVFAVFLVVNVATIVPLYIGSTGDPEATGLHVMLMNVKTDYDNITEVARAITHYDVELLLLEEVDDYWLRTLQPVLSEYPYSVASPRFDNFGIALFSKLPLIDPVVASFGPDRDVPSVQAKIEWQGATLTFLGTHPVPPISAQYAWMRDEQLRAVALHARSLDGAVLLMGDLNTTPWSYHFRHLLDISGLNDCNRGYGLQTTWHARNPVIRIPLDHCLHSSEITILDKRVGRDVGSDHFPIIVSFTL